MKVSKIIILAMMVFLSSVISAQEGIRFMDGSLAAIMSIAKERNKNVFIDTYADWCVPCKRMEEKFKNRDVAVFFNEHFINYRVNMQNPTRAADLRRKYDVVFLPTMYILDPNGIIKYQVDKELTVSELLNAGQASLDPGSYFVSDATAVNRKDGTTTGGIRSKPTITKPIKKKEENPKSVEVVNVEPKKSNTEPKTKPIDIATGGVSISAATRRAKILDSYETVEGSSQKVLAVLGAGELPPEVLRQEAYLRLEFMDGSSNGAAKKYLATQSEWGTDENRKFIMDFLNSTFSKEYKYLVDHKTDFINQFGLAKVKRALEVLTYRTLHNAVPRPTLEEALDLYSNLDETNSKKKATHYYINRLISESNKDEVMRMTDHYLVDSKSDHEIMYIVARYLYTKPNGSEKDLNIAAKLLKNASEINSNSLIYLDLLASIYSDQGKVKKAKKVLEKAAKSAKDQGKDYKVYEEKSLTLEG